MTLARLRSNAHALQKPIEQIAFVEPNLNKVDSSELCSMKAALMYSRDMECERGFSTVKDDILSYTGRFANKIIAPEFLVSSLGIEVQIIAKFYEAILNEALSNGAMTMLYRTVVPREFPVVFPVKKLLQCLKENCKPEGAVVSAPEKLSSLDSSIEIEGSRCKFMISLHIITVGRTIPKLNLEHITVKNRVKM